MKNRKNIGLLAVKCLAIYALFTVSSCKGFLDEVPLSQGAPENFYQNETHAIQALTGAYDGLQIIVGIANGPLQLNLPTDIMRSNQWGGTSGLRAWVISPDESTIRDYWSRHYIGIKNANTAIENIPKVEMDEARKADYISQAKYIRAWLHFNLVRTFGAVPYVTSEFTSLTALKVPRNSVDEIYEGIIEDLQYAVENGHAKEGMGTYRGRASKEAAEGLLSLVYLTRGCMDVRDNKGDGRADFEKAAAHSQNVIMSNKYRLCPYFPDAFIRENKNNDEMLFDVQFKSGGLGEGNYIGMGMGLMTDPLIGGSWATIHSTRYYHLLYEPTDTVRMRWTTTNLILRSREVNGSAIGYLDFAPETTALSNERWKIGKFRRFPVRQASFNYTDFDINWPIMRYAEVLLINAEALNELDKGSTPRNEIFTSLNLLRERARNSNAAGVHADVLPRQITSNHANVPDINASTYPNYTAVKNYIIEERARELGGEGHRWFDLIRWGNLIERVKMLENVALFPEDVLSDGSLNGGDWYNAVSVNIKPHHILMPIPLGEIQANPELLPQNTGY